MEREMPEGQIERYALGEFGDARLKKQERNFMHGWSANKAYACDSLAGIGRGKCVLAASWPTRA
jgi:hypothetical protein